jgi:hypothetical protein
MVQHLPVHEAQCVLDSVGPMGMGTVMQHDDTPHEHVMTLSLYGSTKVSEDYTTVLCIDGDVGVPECQNQWSCLDRF